MSYNDIPTPRMMHETWTAVDGRGNARIVVDYKKAQIIERELATVTKERDELTAWKASALTVESWWSEVDKYVRLTAGSAELGKCVSDIALRFLKERDSLRAEVERLKKQVELANSTVKWLVTPDPAPAQSKPSQESVTANIGGMSMTIHASEPDQKG